MAAACVLIGSVPPASSEDSPQPWAQAYSMLLQFTPRGTHVPPGALVDEAVALDHGVRSSAGGSVVVREDARQHDGGGSGSGDEQHHGCARPPDDTQGRSMHDVPLLCRRLGRILRAAAHARLGFANSPPPRQDGSQCWLRLAAGSSRPPGPSWNSHPRGRRPREHAGPADSVGGGSSSSLSRGAGGASAACWLPALSFDHVLNTCSVMVPPLAVPGSTVDSGPSRPSDHARPVAYRSREQQSNWWPQSGRISGRAGLRAGLRDGLRDGGPPCPPRV